MKNGDQKPESEKHPAKAFAPFPGILCLKDSDKSQSHNDQWPEMRNGLANVDDVEIIEKKNQSCRKKN